MFRIAGVRCFKEGAPASGILEKLRKLAVTVCVSVVPVSDQAVADFVRSEYMGLDSIMPRLKRKNPVLYGILAQEKDAVSNEQNYVWGGIYFCLMLQIKMRCRKNKADGGDWKAGWSNHRYITACPA